MDNNKGIGSIGVALAVVAIMYFSGGDATTAAGIVGCSGFFVVWGS